MGHRLAGGLMGLLDPPGFKRNRHGEVWLHLSGPDRALMDNLLSQLTELLTQDGESAPNGRPADPLADLVGIEPGAVRPADPALARLFPDAYADPEEADEFRRFTQRDLRTIKLANARAAHACLERANPTKLSEAEQTAWLTTLNDLRLTLGTRLGVTEDPIDLDQLDGEDPAVGMYLVYDWLTYHQDRLVHALAKGM